MNRDVTCIFAWDRGNQIIVDSFLSLSDKVHCFDRKCVYFYL